MKILLSWLREFAPITGEPEEIASQLTNLGLVVESVQLVGANWDGIIVAKVLALGAHPEADRIQLVAVDVGNGEGLQICCGAFNMAVGDLVPLATIGTVMPGGMEIAERKLRGQMSNGMICSEPELGLELSASSDADGIMILDPELTVGQPLSEALGVESDVVFDIDVEGNRPDALSVLGVARDLAAKQDVPLEIRQSAVPETEPPASSRASVELAAGKLCARFGLRVLHNVAVTQSPAWMAARLTAAGMRPINSIVDISNYVMLELGQPNHTYDLALVPAGALRVRMGREGESLMTLDGQQRAISSEDGVIANAADEPIGLAGVMGGESTEISPATTSVLLEAAIWDPMTIAWTSRRMSLRSEASTRYERGVDPLGLARALDRFCELAVEHCGATVAKDPVIVEGSWVAPEPVTLRVAKLNSLLNLNLTGGQIGSYLSAIGFGVEAASAGELRVAVPSWRPDCSIEEDLIEEVGRHHGYDKSGKRVPRPAQSGALSDRQLGRRRIRRAMEAAGYCEAMPMPFLAPGDLESAGLDGTGLSLTNPLVADESILRTSLLPGLLKTVAYNQSRRNEPIRLYEYGTIYLPPAPDAELPDEQQWLAAATVGSDARVAAALMAQLGQALNLQGLLIKNARRAGLHPTRSAEVVFRGRTIGEIGEVSPEVCEAFEVSGRVAWLQLDTKLVLDALAKAPKYSSVSRFPPSDVDLAFVVDNAIPASDVERALQKAGGDLVQSVKLFDTFRGEKLGPDCRSLAYNIRLRASDRTLEEDDVVTARQKLIDAVVNNLPAKLR